MRRKCCVTSRHPRPARSGSLAARADQAQPYARRTACGREMDRHAAGAAAPRLIRAQPSGSVAPAVAAGASRPGSGVAGPGGNRCRSDHHRYHLTRPGIGEMSIMVTITSAPTVNAVGLSTHSPPCEMLSARVRRGRLRLPAPRPCSRARYRLRGRGHRLAARSGRARRSVRQR